MTPKSREFARSDMTITSGMIRCCMVLLYYCTTAFFIVIESAETSEN